MLNQLFDKAALTYSDATAIIHGERRISFFELQLYVEWMAGYFQSITLRSGQHVAILIPNSPEFVISFFGLVRVGGVAVPLDVTSKENELRAALSLAEVSAVITTPEYKPVLDKVLAESNSEDGFLPRLTVAVFEEDNIATLNHFSREQQTPAADSRKNGKAAISNSHCKDYVPTLLSGRHVPASETEKIFTDHPAAIQISTAPADAGRLYSRSHHDLVRQAEQMCAQFHLTSADHVLCLAPLCQQNSLGNCLIAVIAAGATLIMLDSNNWNRILQVLAEEQITILASSSAQLAHLTKNHSDELSEISSLRCCLNIDAPSPSELRGNLPHKIGFNIWQ
ncbi:MAG: long-chain fatty acid--CoA ligase [candidate division KSB1 bacterium]|nr:long-chain fatty acid--CoA ligase [candidate division KSB1 bacterium]MDZ7302285.1 long-chain fatty acid--CoA ligase [candidate division KSB1 bacterium]MDZ7311391.1 long-chain fatty acid--CoA ligase [candidate division KSB1 bacterium]